MSEQQADDKPTVLVDKEAAERYNFVVDTGKRIFHNSAILNQDEPVSPRDLGLIQSFHQVVSPTNPGSPWRITREERSQDRKQIIDPSSFGSWEAAGGPLEHIILTSSAAALIVEQIKQNLKNPADVDDQTKSIIDILKSIDPNHAAAAAALHDEGREVTHLFYTNDLIGRQLLRRIGIRSDIMNILPSEEVMLLPKGEDMDDAIKRLPPEVVIVRIADDFGKRAPGTNRLYQPEDYDDWDRDTWAQGYLSHPFSGRPSEAKMRVNMQLHIDNAPRYIKALDNWLRSVSYLTLDDLTKRLNNELSHTLPPLIG